MEEKKESQVKTIRKLQNNKNPNKINDKQYKEQKNNLDFEDDLSSEGEKNIQKGQNEIQNDPKQQLLDNDDDINDQNEGNMDNDIDSPSKKSPDKKLKRKINVTKQDQKKQLYGIKDDPYNYEPQQGEYFNINMDLAISYVFQKSKPLRDKIENENISNQFLKEHVIDNKHFNLAYNSFLQKLCNNKTLHPEFKNVQKKTMSKLENFFIERIDKCVEQHNIHLAYQEKAKYIQECFDKRLQELKDKINQKNKLGD